MEKGDWALFWFKEELHEGKIFVVDEYPNGMTTVDIMCKGKLYKHLDPDDVIESIRIGFDAESCVEPPRWKNIPDGGSIVERQVNTCTKV